VPVAIKQFAELNYSAKWPFITEERSNIKISAQFYGWKWWKWE